MRDPYATRILALDPASKICGYALLDLRKDGVDLFEVGRLTSPKKNALDRVRELAADLYDILILAEVENAVVEIPDGKVHASIRGRAGGAGLTVYGMAAGFLLAQCDSALGSDAVHTVGQNAWTGGLSKDARARNIARLYPRHDWGPDGGHDAADAVGVGLWWAARFGIEAGLRRGATR